MSSSFFSGVRNSCSRNSAWAVSNSSSACHQLPSVGSGTGGQSPSSGSCGLPCSSRRFTSRTQLVMWRMISQIECALGIGRAEACWEVSPFDHLGNGRSVPGIAGLGGLDLRRVKRCFRHSSQKRERGTGNREQDQHKGGNRELEMQQKAVIPRAQSDRGISMPTWHRDSSLRSE